MKRAALRASAHYTKKAECLALAAERRERAKLAWKRAEKGDRNRRWDEYVAATAAELKAAL